MPPLCAYRLTCVSLTLDVGCLFTAAPGKHSCFPDLGRGVASLSWVIFMDQQFGLAKERREDMNDSDVAMWKDTRFMDQKIQGIKKLLQLGGG